MAWYDAWFIIYVIWLIGAIYTLCGVDSDNKFLITFGIVTFGVALLMFICLILS